MKSLQLFSLKFTLSFAIAWGSFLSYSQVDYAYEIEQIVDSSLLAASEMGYTIRVEGNYLFAGNPGKQAVSIFSRATVNDPWSLLTEIVPSDPYTNTEYGSAIAVDGDYLVVGAYDYGIYSFQDYGRVYIYKKDLGGTDNWGELTKVQASDSSNNGNFGYSVDIHDDEIIVGARGDLQAYILGKDVGGVDNWGEKKIIAGDASDSFFGRKVLIMDTLAFVSGESSASDGEVHIYGQHRGGVDNWGLVKTLSVWNDYFGESMDFDGTSLAVAARKYSSGYGNAYIFERDQGGTNNWGTVASITASDQTTLNSFAYSVAIEGDYLLVGARPLDASNGSRVYEYQKNLGGPNNWGESGMLLASDGHTSDGFYYASDIQGNEFYVGARGGLVDGVYSGKVYRYSGDSCYTTHHHVYDSIYYDEAYFFGGNVYQYAGTYYDSTVTSAGCDSISILHLSVRSRIKFDNKWDFGAGNGTYDVALGDLNGDGKIDMVSANHDGNNISVFQNQTPVGVINPATFIPSFHIPAGTTTTGVEIFDVDGDGRNDIVALARDSDSVYVFRTTGTVGGSMNAAYFAPKVAFLTSDRPIDLERDDLDGDGKIDIIVTSEWDEEVSVLKNISTPGSPVFATKIDYPVNDIAPLLGTGDINNDGKPEIISTTNDWGELVAFQNYSVVGGIAFGSMVYLEGDSGSNYGAPQAYDFDGDGCNDPIVTLPNELYTYKYNCTTGPLSMANYTLNSGGTYVDNTSWGGTGYVSRMSDLDGNGKDDIMTTSRFNSSTGTYHAIANIANGDANLDALDFHISSVNYATDFTNQPHMPTAFRPVNLRLGDIDNDGLDDMAICNFGDNKVMVFKNISSQSTVMPGDTIATSIVGGLTNFCAGDTLNVSFTSSATFASGNTFIVQLSDASGSFGSPTVIGSLSGATIANIECIIPGTTAFGTNYRIRVVSTSSYLVGQDNGANITINEAQFTNISAQICPGETYTFGSQTLNTPGTYTDIFTSANGCDSTVTLNLSYKTGDVVNISETACESYTWSANSTTYTSSGTYTEVLTNMEGCDSTVTLNLTINNSSTSTTNETACDSYTWNGTTYTANGTYTWTGTNAAGCDSIATLNLTINNSTTSTTTETGCDSYTWNGTTYTSSGTYTWTGTNAVGCDSVATLNLTINNSTTSTTAETACGSYSWNGTTYTSSGTYTWTGTNAAGCDSVATLNLTINNSTTSTTTETACDSYTWNGTTYTSSGTYTWTGTNTAGCDSVATLNLTINNSTTSTTMETACDNYTWNGTTYTSSGTYTWTGMNAAGCDSVATLNLTINNSTTSTTNETACSSYSWNGTTYTSSGTYTWTGTNAAGCDSVATLNLTINNSTTSTTTETACDSYTWNGTTYTSSGTYTWTGMNAAGCDSVATLNLTINNSSTSTSTETACDSYTWNGTTYTSSGTYTWTGTNVAGCDSVATLNLTINNSSTSTSTETACDSYTWNGTTYTSSGVYTWTGTNAEGCDSVATLNLTINNSMTSTTTETACDSYTWNGTTYTSSGTYTWTGTNAAGCDSVATLNLTINNSTTSTTTETACDSYTWNSTTYTSSGTYTWTGTNAAGCDSVATLNLTINNSTTSTTMETACDSYTWNGTTYASSGTYTWTGTNATGCDSVATLNLTINNSTTSTTTETACDSYTWNGTTYTSSGTYTWTGTNAAGCDSVATLNLTINNSSTSTTTETACDSYSWNGTTYTSSGTYTWTGTNAAGCDSVATLNLTINNSSTSTTMETACDNYTWNGTTYTTSGTYTWTGMNAAGCDSVATLNLTINNSTTSTTTETACDSYAWNGTTYTSSGTYTWIGTNAAGCDSVATLNLTINNSTTSTTTETACDSYTWNGTTYTSSGTYTWIGTNAAGCDSVVTLNLTINNSTTSTTTETACNSYSWNGTTYTSSGTYTWTGTNAAGCDSVATLNLTINNFTTSTTTETACDGYTWNGTTYTSSGTYTWTGTNAAGCDSVATLNLTINNSTTSTTTEIACDSYTWNGTTYTSSGMYTWTGTNAAGCDSVATLNLTINTSVTSTATETACDSYTWNGTTYTSSGTYTWTGTSASGCDSIVTLNLTINGSTTGIDEITACGSYTWIDGVTYTANNNTATYTLTNTAGCDSIVTLDLMINPVPNNGVTQNGNVLESDQAGATYQWLDCDNDFDIIAGETNQSFATVQSVAGNYAVEVTLNGCIDTSECYVVDFTGLEDLSKTTLRLFPNPTFDVLTIDGINDLNGVESIEITSTNGSIVSIYREVIDDKLNVIDLPAGAYFIRIVHEKGTENLRFVKQ